MATTIQLNLELSDEQYQQLMEKSFDTVINQDETVKALRGTITDTMSKYLTEHQDLIKDQFYDKNYWGQYTTANSMTKNIVAAAAEETSKKIQDAVEGYMLDVMKTQNIDDIVLKILAAGIMSGVVSGLDSWRNAAECEIHMNTSGITNIANRLGFEDVM